MGEYPVTRSQDRLVCVVVTYNRLEKLKVTIRHLLENRAYLTALLVIDNASDDGTSAWLEQQSDPLLRVIHSKTNLGGAGGFELGMRRAQELFDPDWLLIMDDDAWPDAGALAQFHSANKTGIAAIAAAVYMPDGSICEMNRPSRNPFWQNDAFWGALTRGRAGFHLPDAAYGGAPVDVDVSSFVGFFISRAGLVSAGLPNPNLFLYGDDAIYTLGLRARGERLSFRPDIRFIHDSSTFAKGERRFRPLWKAYYYQRNLLILYRMAAGWLFWPVLLVILPRWLARTGAHRGERRAFLRLTLAAIRHGLARSTRLSHQEVCALARPQASKISR